MATTTPEELGYIRSQYYGKLAMVDRWFGELLDELDKLELWEDTMVVVTTDHGHDLGERGAFGKQYPHFDSHANIPLFLWHPENPGNGRAVMALSSTVDLFATILEAAGASPLGPVHSRSVLPLLSGNGPNARETLLYGTFGQGVFKSLIVDSVASPTGHGHYVPYVDLEQWQVPVKIDSTTVARLGQINFLFNRSEDPGQSRNLWNEELSQRKRMVELARELMVQEGAPSEQYERLGLES
jgi:hypothetical protein